MSCVNRKLIQFSARGKMGYPRPPPKSRFYAHKGLHYVKKSCVCINKNLGGGYNKEVRKEKVLLS